MKKESKTVGIVILFSLITICSLLNKTAIVSTSANTFKKTRNMGISDNVDSLNIISPENETILTEAPLFIYTASSGLKDLEVWLNNTKLEEIDNNTIMPIYLRGNYILRVIGIFEEGNITQVIWFSYLPKIKIDVAYTAKLINTRCHINYTKPTPVYSQNETIVFYANTNEHNNTLKLLITYGSFLNPNTYLTTLKEYSNYTWVNRTCLKITINPIEVKFTWHMLLFNVSSTLDKSTNNITFAFIRAVKVYTEIFPSAYDNFLNTTVSGYVSCRFIIYTSLIPIINLSIYLDDVLLKQFYYPTGDFFDSQYFTITIDTTQYPNGNHNLDIYVTEFFNLTKVYHYILIIYNPSEHSLINTNTSAFPSMIISMSILIAGLCSILLKRRKLKKFV